VPIAFDTTGLQQHDRTTWFNPANGDQIDLTHSDQAPDLPASLDDLPKLRHDLAVATGEVGCLIEAHPVRLGDVPALFQVVKLPLPDQPTGQAFVGSFTVPKANGSAVLKLQAVEQGTTGTREAVLAAQIGFDNWVMPHPYAPEVEGRLPFHAGDDPRFDAQFGDHPLARVRAWAHHTIRTARVDPRFAALPPFQPAAAPPPASGPSPDTSPVPIQSAPLSAPPSAPLSAPADRSAHPDESTSSDHSAPPAPPVPEVGSTLTTVVPGIPIGGYLPLWINDECTFWRMTEPEPVLDRLALGALARTQLADQRFRDVVALDESSSTIMLLNRYRAEDGGIASGMTKLTRVTGRAAHEALTTDTLLDAFRWIGRVSVAAAERGEYVTIEPGTHNAGLTEPYVLLVVQEHEGRRLSITRTAPAPPADTPMWNGTASVTGPATRESIEAGGLLSMYAMNKWGEHPLRLCLTFGPIPTPEHPGTS
jgi:hypothetical protein